MKLYQTLAVLENDRMTVYFMKWDQAFEQWNPLQIPIRISTRDLTEAKASDIAKIHHDSCVRLFEFCEEMGML